MKVSFEGFGQRAASFYDAETGGCVKGKPVKMTGNCTVGTCGAGDVPAGICLDVKDGLATVITEGFVTAAYTGTAPAVGYSLLAGDGAGAMKAVTTGGRSYLVLSVDTQAKTVGFML